MAFDGIVTRSVTRELGRALTGGKVEKIYQPEKDELVFFVHGPDGRVRFYASSNNDHAGIWLTQEQYDNPANPSSFCMLLRKHLQGSRIVDIVQVDTERIIEISFESRDEMGFRTDKKLIIEIMGKHSNIVLTDMETGKILDSIKRVGFDVNRVRQTLPGLIYQYPPEQDKIPFDELSGHEDEINSANDGKMLMGLISGIAPSFAAEAASHADRAEFIESCLEDIEEGRISPRMYLDPEGTPREYYFRPLGDYEDTCEVRKFDTLSECLEAYYSLKVTSNQAKQKSADLMRAVNDILSKKYLKKKRLNEDLLEAENSDELRLYGELLTANIHMVKQGMKSVDVISYYDGSTVHIPLDVRKSPSANAQHYYKKYGKAKTAIKEKKIQIQENDEEIAYLESVLGFIDKTESVEEAEAIRQELTETGYLRPRKKSGFKEKKSRPQPMKYRLSGGMTCLVGRNNKENDYLTFKLSNKGDLWLHTKDIPGSHVLIQTGGEQVSEEDIFEAAGIAAFHSKASDSENVPVDYVPIRYVKKPQGAKPGMVIFTNNRTVYTNPKEGNKI